VGKAASQSHFVTQSFVYKPYVSTSYFSKTRPCHCKLEGLKTQNSNKQASNSNNTRTTCNAVMFYSTVKELLSSEITHWTQLPHMSVGLMSFLSQLCSFIYSSNMSQSMCDLYFLQAPHCSAFLISSLGKLFHWIPRCITHLVQGFKRKDHQTSTCNSIRNPIYNVMKRRTLF
jgi:hypothetical protein